MKNLVQTITFTLASLVMTSEAFAHSGAEAIHHFDLAGAVLHVLTSPDHLMPFLLVALVGTILGVRVLMIRGRNKRR